LPEGCGSRREGKRHREPLGDDIEEREDDASKHHEGCTGNGAGMRDCKGILIHVFHPDYSAARLFRRAKDAVEL
jgi:hypothetical protein